MAIRSRSIVAGGIARAWSASATAIRQSVREGSSGLEGENDWEERPLASAEDEARGANVERRRVPIAE